MNIGRINNLSLSLALFNRSGQLRTLNIIFVINFTHPPSNLSGSHRESKDLLPVQNQGTILACTGVQTDNRYIYIPAHCVWQGKVDFYAEKCSANNDLSDIDLIICRATLQTTVYIKTYFYISSNLPESQCLDSYLPKCIINSTPGLVSWIPLTQISMCWQKSRGAELVLQLLPPILSGGKQF